MVGYIIVIGILIFIGIFAFSFLGAVVDWLIEEHPILGGIIGCIVLAAIVWGIIWLFVNL